MAIWRRRTLPRRSAGTSDDSDDTYTVTLSVAHGTVSVASHSGLTGTFSGSSFSFSGSLANVDTALADGDVTYTPTSGFIGSDTLTFSATSTEEAGVGGGTSRAASHTASITVNNETVTGTAGSITTTEGTATAGALASNDPDSDATFAIAANPRHGTLSNFNSATGTFTYTPTGEFEGSDSFTFTVTDEGVTSAAAVAKAIAVATRDLMEVDRSLRWSDQVPQVSGNGKVAVRADP